MDYYVGGVAALISGDVTPNRPRLAKTALTPIKHKPSPNITPKSAIITDRSALLSPSVQKKKALVKKSPKRIFQNPDMNVTDDGQVLPSPKGEKAKKHLKNHLGGEEDETITNNGVKINNHKSMNENVKENSLYNLGKTPKKNKNKKILKLEAGKNLAPVLVNISSRKSPSKLDANEHNGAPMDDKSETLDLHTAKSSSDNNVVKKKNKKNIKKNSKLQLIKKAKKSVFNQPTKIYEEQEKMEINPDSEVEEETIPELRTKNKKKKSKKNIVLNQSTKIVEEQEKMEINPDSEAEQETIPELPTKNKKKKSKKNIVNPNAVTNKDSDSEHESDGESLESEDEKNNKQVLEAKEEGESSDEEDDDTKEKEIKKVEKPESEINIQEELDRTIFIGNVPFSKKSKKQIKKIFCKHGEIDSMRIRSVPVKDPTMTPKLAVIKGEIHPERSTVNVYVKYKDVASVESALTENNVVLDGMHLRVSRSEISNLENDPNCSVFVGNLPLALEDEALWSKFESCGEIKSVRIIRDKKTSCGKGFGYVNFTSRDGVELALAMLEEDLTIKNRILRVKRISQLLPKHKGQKKATGRKKNEKNTSQNFQSRNQGIKRFPNRNQNGDRFQNGNQGGNKFQNRNQGANGFQNRNQGGNGFQTRNQGGNSFQNRNQAGNSFQNRNQGGNSFQNRNQGGNGFQNRKQGGNGFQNRKQGGIGFQNRNQGGNGFQNRNQGGNKRPFASRQFGNGDQDQAHEKRPFGQRNEGIGSGSHMKQPEDGAHRRIAKKRKSQESSSEAPASKRPKEDQPRKEKKPRKEFVGVTAEKKKKKKQDKGQKKKKALSEILTKS